MTYLINACTGAWEGVSSLALFTGTMILSLSLDLAPDPSSARDVAGQPARREASSASALCENGPARLQTPRHCVPQL